MLMNKIENVKSIYSPEQYLSHNMKRLEVLELRCEYPVIIEKDTALVGVGDWQNGGKGNLHSRSKLGSNSIKSSRVQ